MIERLFNEERPGQSPERSEVGQLREQLLQHLEPSEKALLEQLLDAYLRRSSTEVRDAFAEGFCAAVELMLDCVRCGH